MQLTSRHGRMCRKCKEEDRRRPPCKCFQTHCNNNGERSTRNGGRGIRLGGGKLVMQEDTDEYANQVIHCSDQYCDDLDCVC
eukprot:scaffold39184_cov23-Tisochrysis_lutea.AAC.1